MTAANGAYRHGDPDTIAADFEVTFAGCPGLVAVTTLPGGLTRFYPATELAPMVAYITMASSTMNVYVMVSTVAARPAHGRGGEADALALPGLILDLDVAGPAHADVAGRLPLPADHHEALALVDQMPVRPTMIVDTGHGLLVHYLFDHPMVMATAIERAGAKDLSARWNARAVEVGQRHGVHVDSVGDLARLRRVAGTWNRKCLPAVPVVVDECHPRRRYRPEDLAAVLPAKPAPPSPPRNPERPIPPPRLDGRESPAEAFSRCVRWETILEPAGFAELATRGDITYWRHPAASSPMVTPSATTGARDRDVLVVFSESAAAATGLPAGAGHRLTKFRCWAHLHYRGDEAAAARALRELGRRAG